MLWEPHLEGRNVNATFFEIYFMDAFLAYAYAVSVAFFTALYQAFKVLGYIGQNKVFSPHSKKSIRIIKHCAASLVGFVAAPVVYLLIVRPGDDIAGGVAIGLFLIFLSSVTAAVADVFEKVLHSVAE